MVSNIVYVIGSFCGASMIGTIYHLITNTTYDMVDVIINEDQSNVAKRYDFIKP